MRSRFLGAILPFLVVVSRTRGEEGGWGQGGWGEGGRAGFTTLYVYISIAGWWTRHFGGTQNCSIGLMVVGRSQVLQGHRSFVGCYGRSLDDLGCRFSCRALSIVV